GGERTRPGLISAFTRYRCPPDAVTGAGSPAIGSNIGASFGPGTFGAGSNGPSSGNFHSPGVQSSGSSPGNSGGINEEFRRINGPGNNQPRIMSGGFHFRR